jgi:hypothetical protein
VGIWPRSLFYDNLDCGAADNLAEKAKAAGLLEKDAIETMVRETLRRRSIDELFKAADRLATCANAPITPEEIQQEVNTHQQNGERCRT